MAVCSSSFIPILTRVWNCGVKGTQKEITTLSSALGIFRRHQMQLAKQKTLYTGQTYLSRQPSSSSSTPMTVNDAKSILAQFPGGSVDLSKDESNGLAVVTLNNPTKKNALTGTMAIQLAEAVTELEHWKDGRYVILRGEGGFFCSGADFNLVRGILQTDNSGIAIPTLLHEILYSFSSLPLISVALVEGAAFGGGAELTTCCDFRIATDASRVAFLHVKLGVVPGFGGGASLTSIVGRKNALDLLASSRTLTMTEAEQIGFVDHIVPDGSSEQSLLRVTEWLTTRYPHGTQPMRAAKMLVQAAASSFNAESLAAERELFVNLWGSPAHRKVFGLDK